MKAQSRSTSVCLLGINPTLIFLRTERKKCVQSGSPFLLHQFSKLSKATPHTALSPFRRCGKRMKFGSLSLFRNRNLLGELISRSPVINLFHISGGTHLRLMTPNVAESGSMGITGGQMFNSCVPCITNGCFLSGLCYIPLKDRMSLNFISP